jgi:hypothetical protein
MRRESVRTAILDYMETFGSHCAFGSNQLVQFVRSQLGQFVMDATITNEMRRMRKNGYINYRCIDTVRSQYQFDGFGKG